MKIDYLPISVVITIILVVLSGYTWANSTFASKEAVCEISRDQKVIMHNLVRLCTKQGINWEVPN